MAHPTQIFWKRLASSGLLSDDELKDLESRFREAGLLGESSELKPLARQLVKDKVLTTFQAKTLAARTGIPLCWNEYTIIAEREDSLFPGTYVAVHGPSGHEVDLRVIPEAELPAGVDPSQVAPTVARLRALHQDQVLAVYEWVSQPGWYGLVLEPCRGTWLAERLQPGVGLELGESISVAYQVAQALCAYQASGLVHGDVRPANLLCTSGGRIKLWRDPFDRPVSVHAASGAELKRLEVRAPYLAPEFHVLESPASHLTDVYALGCLFYQLLSGKTPFPGPSLAQMMDQHAKQRIASLETYGVPSAIEQIVTYLMAKRPHLRYQDAEAVSQQLLQFAGDQFALAPPTPRSDAQVAYERWIQQKRGTAPADSVTAGVAPEVSREESFAPARLLAARQKARRRQRLVIGSIAGVVALSLAVGGLWWLFQGGSGTGDGTTVAEGDDPANDGGDGDATTQVSFDPDAAVPQIVEPDDGELLWESPTQGSPLGLDWLPDQPRMLIALRPNHLLSSPEGALLFQGLGQRFAAGVTEWESLAGVSVEAVEELVVSLHDGPTPQAAYQPVYRVELSSPMAAAELVAAWTQGSGSLDSSRRVEQGSFGYWIPDDEQALDAVTTFVMGERARVDELAGREGRLPALLPDLRGLVESTDADRDFNLVFIASNLTRTAGREWMTATWQPLWEPLQGPLQSGLTGGVLSLHLDGDWYLELALKGQVSQTPEQLADQLSRQLPDWTTRIEQVVAQVPTHPYWERVRLRYVTWVRDLMNSSRVGVEYRMAKLNVWMPGMSAHNLIASTELLLASQVEASGAGEVAGGGEPMAKAPESLAELLTRPVDFKVSSNDMINVMAELQQSVVERYPGLPFEFKIHLLGNDLRLEGITQNQRISNFDRSDTALGEVLTGLVVVANPDKASTGPTDDKQKLVWVVGPDPDDASRMAILITTRAAATDNGYRLPESLGGTDE